MMDWKVVDQEGQKHTQKGWFFPNLSIQEYLLPFINVGHDYIDENNTTLFQKEDCRRLKHNITYLLGSKYFDQKTQIQYDSISQGLITLESKDIIESLLHLHTAAEQAMQIKGYLQCDGD
ncbi:MAG: hypothetical protein Q9M28_05465 [Mariprofundaceae bacterium]|nr:hypothetical protein [Mariprofundaceae bacterium]